MIEAVRHVKAQAIDVKFVYPKTNAIQQIVYNSRVFQVQLHKLKVPFPSFIPEPVVVAAVAVKADVEPVFIRRIPFLFLHVSECPEPAPYMIKHPVQYDLHPMCVKIAAHFAEICVCPKAAVDGTEIPGVVAVIVRFKNRIQKDRAHSQILQIFRPVKKLADPRDALAVVMDGRAAEADRIYLIKYTVICPHRINLISLIL